MSHDIRIDFVAPPFAGHLYPALDLARRLRERGVTGIRILSTSGAMSAITAAGFPFVEILPGRDQQVWQIANTHNRVGSNPLRMWRQVQSNLALMEELQQQLQAVWQTEPPDLVIADFVVPVAGLTAHALGIHWWTGMPSPCALETSDGTPAYVGGWMPRSDLIGKFRDRVGRLAVRTFKKTSAWMFSSQLKALSITSMYRVDGTEVVYSPERILAYGMREFEFEQRWPTWLQFIGPLTSAPPLPGPELQWEPGKKTVLVTLGTHLSWAKSRAIDIVREVSRRMPETLFHFSRGEMGSQDVEVHGNLHLYGSIPYDAGLNRYDAAIIHGGTGITYACIRNAVPMLVWPHDYDQFDHAARIVHHQLGIRLKPTAERIVSDLRTLLTASPIRNSLQRFQSRLQEYDPGQSVLDAIRSLEHEETGISLLADSGD